MNEWELLMFTIWFIAIIIQLVRIEENTRKLRGEKKKGEEA